MAKIRIQLMIPEDILKDVLNLKGDRKTNDFIQNLIISGLITWKKQDYNKKGKK